MSLILEKLLKFKAHLNLSLNTKNNIVFLNLWLNTNTFIHMSYFYII